MILVTTYDATLLRRTYIYNISQKPICNWLSLCDINTLLRNTVIYRRIWGLQIPFECIVFFRKSLCAIKIRYKLKKMEYSKTSLLQTPCYQQDKFVINEFRGNQIQHL